MTMKYLNEIVSVSCIFYCIIDSEICGHKTGYQFYQNHKIFNPTLTDNYRSSNKMTSIEYLCVILGFCTAANLSVGNAQINKLRLVYSWNQLEFDYPTPQARQTAIDNGEFTPSAIAPIDTDVYYSASNPNNNEVFVTIPRFTTGIPATLGTVTNKNLSGNPIIRPYPSWSWHRNFEQCHSERIISVFRVQVDECGRLWVLDTGKIGDQIICQPQILAFDLETNRLIHRYEIPKSVLPPLYLLITPVVDVRNPESGCTDTFIYMADVSGFSLLVYDVANRRSWRTQNKNMYPDPDYGTYTIAGDSFELMDGILGLALTPYIRGEDRILYYHAMSSGTENWVRTSDLRNSTRFQSDPSSSPALFHTYKQKRNTQSAAEAINKDGILIFGLLGDIKLACWNTQTEYNTKRFDIIGNDPVTLQFPSGVKILKNKKGQEELWILTSRFQKIAAGTLNTNDRNFRILATKLDDILHGSSCKSKHFNSNQILGQFSSTGGFGLLNNINT